MLRPFTPTRCLVLLTCVSCILLFTLVPRYDLLNEPQSLQVVARALPGFPNPGNGDDAGNADDGTDNSSVASPAAGGSSASVPSAASSPPAQVSPGGQSSSSNPAQDTTTPPPQQTTSQPPPSSTTSPSSTPGTPSATPDKNTSSSNDPGNNTSSSSQQNTQQTSAPPTSTAAPTPTVSESVSTNAEGETSIVLVTVYPSDTSSSAAPSDTAVRDQTDESDKGVSTSTIVGLSVAGGIALLGIIAFVIWKFTRKRSTDDFDDNEAIKWPELNAHGESNLTLPTNRAGMETNSEVNLTRPDSRAGSIAPSAATSAVDLYAPNAAQDPYAVPPLPHLNPNQPYRDDPSGPYYDPYNGPVPQTFAEPPGGEAIPMTQINRSRSTAPVYDAGRRSPGPQAIYYPEGGRSSPAPGAMSSGPGMVLSGRMSPGPGPALAGRASPAPGQAYGYAG